MLSAVRTGARVNPVRSLRENQVNQLTHHIDVRLLQEALTRETHTVLAGRRDDQRTARRGFRQQVPPFRGSSPPGSGTAQASVAPAPSKRSARGVLNRYGAVRADRDRHRLRRNGDLRRGKKPSLVTRLPCEFSRNAPSRVKRNSPLGNMI